MKQPSFTSERTAQVFDVLKDPAFIDENFSQEFFSVDFANSAVAIPAIAALEANPKFYLGMILALLLGSKNPTTALKVMFLAGLLTGVRVADVLELKRMEAQ